jgi:hypothetical protein
MLQREVIEGRSVIELWLGKHMRYHTFQYLCCGGICQYAPVW